MALLLYINTLTLLQDHITKTRELERELRALTIEKTRAENLLEVNKTVTALTF